MLIEGITNQCQARTWVGLIIMALSYAAAIMMSDRDIPEKEASKSFPDLSGSFPTQAPTPAGIKEQATLINDPLQLEGARSPAAFPCLHAFIAQLAKRSKHREQ